MPLLSILKNINPLSELALYDKDQQGLNEVLKSMGYEETQLRSKLFIYRVNNSDYIDVQFESENPELSAYVANTLCHEFLSYYDALKKSNQNKAVNFFRKTNAGKICDHECQNAGVEEL